MRPLLAGFILLFVLFNGCKKENEVTNPDQIVGSGKLITQNRTTGAFTGIQVTGMAKVIVKQDTVQSLRIEADDNIMDSVTTTTSDGLLSVGLKKGSYTGITVNVYASMKTINDLESTGAAEFLTDGQIQTDSVLCRITGAGKITLKGAAAVEKIEITGTGDIHNFDLVSSRCSATISGAGNVEVNVTQDLTAVIAGTGNITYSGNPASIHQTITGVGSVKTKP